MSTEKIVEVSEGPGFTAQQVRSRIATYQHEIAAYLDSVEGNADGYKFAVEKQGDAPILDMAVEAQSAPRIGMVPPSRRAEEVRL
jgi:hypothetical protein